MAQKGCFASDDDDPGVCLEGLRKTMKDVDQDSQ
jgi:hypothetical protein